MNAVKAFWAGLLVCAAAGSAVADTFVITDARLQVSAPDEFRRLSRADIDALYAPARGPAMVIAKSDRTLLVSYDFKFETLGGLTLEQALPTFVGVFEKVVPGLVWKARKVAELAGQQWLRLDFVSRSRNVDYRNVMWVTERDGRLLVLNFVVTEELAAAAEPLLNTMMQSVKLNVEISAPPTQARPAPGAKNKP